jgi:hypothetical protein
VLDNVDEKNTKEGAMWIRRTAGEGTQCD